MAEITNEGYVAKTENEYFSEERQLYLDIDSNWNVDPSTPDGLKVAHDAEIFTNLDESLQFAYNSKDPNKARGVDLDIISALTGTFRDLGSPSNVDVTLGGTPGTVILSGKIIESPVDGSQWTIDTTVTISGGGTIAATATATVSGATQADIDTITTIVDTVGGWQTVTNPNVATPGTDIQTDAQLRLERALSVGGPGTNQIDSIIGVVFGVDDVRRVRVYENETDIVQPVTGLTAHSLAVLVDGGVNEDIAQAIFSKRSTGVTQFQAGTPVNVLVQSEKYPQQLTDIKFGRPTYVDMVVTVTVQSDGSLPNDANEQIKQAILDYTAGSLTNPECGFNQLGFDIGEDVVLSRLYTPINSVIGSYGNSYVLGLTLQGGTSNITIDFDELSRWTDANITVTINA